MSMSYEYEQLEFERELEVCKRNDLIQQSRFTLTVQEQRMVLYAISKIKPDDEARTIYSFDIKDFYRVAGLKDESYTRFKDIIKKLAERSWWVELINEKKEQVERLMMWFSLVEIVNKSTVRLKFHEGMEPYLFQLVQSGAFYTTYNLEYVLPMKSQYSPRLYEILKSYQHNNNEWYFDTDKLKKLLDCENYERFPDFRRKVLEPAVEEINLYTDLKIFYKTETKGRKVIRICFYMDKKTISEQREARDARAEELGQLTIEDMIINAENAPEVAFMRERWAAHDEEKRNMISIGKGKK